MVMDFDHHRPIYLQIKEALYHMIARVELSPGMKVPSVRETAMRMQVNPNTVQRAYRELEEENLFFTRRGQGTFVTEDEEKIFNLRKRLGRESAATFVQTGISLGLDRKALLELLQDAIKKEDI